MTEYEYLRRCVWWRFQSQLKQLAKMPRNNEADEIRIIIAQRQLFWQRIRSEDIIHWLELDAECRRFGSSYPDEVEKLDVEKFFRRIS